jgi:hypothetical protein
MLIPGIRLKIKGWISYCKRTALLARLPPKSP